jgi:nucleotide-binding universal stress UspA family protein
MKTIVVPVDGSELSERALDHAAALARQLDASLVLVTHREGGVIVDPLGYLRQRAAAVGFPAAEIRHLTEGYPAQAIAELVGRLPDPTVVMSTRGHTRLSAAFLGSIAEQLLRALAAPVVLVGPACRPAPAPVETLILAMPPQPPGPSTIAHVEHWCRRLDVPLRALRVVPESTTDAALDAVRAELCGYLDAAATFAHPPRVSVMRADDVAETVALFANTQAGSLLVLVTAARTGFDRLRLGSVATDVVRRAHGPVLVLRAPSTQTDRPDQ